MKWVKSAKYFILPFSHKITKKDVEYTKYKDKLKTEYAKNKNIRLIRIRYTDFDNIEKILKKELISS